MTFIRSLSGPISRRLGNRSSSGIPPVLLFFVVFAFAPSFSGARAAPAKNAPLSPGLPLLELETISRNPDRYINRVVRVRGSATSNRFFSVRAPGQKKIRRERKICLLKDKVCSANLPCCRRCGRYVSLTGGDRFFGLRLFGGYYFCRKTGCAQTCNPPYGGFIEAIGRIFKVRNSGKTEFFLKTRNIRLLGAASQTAGMSLNFGRCFPRKGRLFTYTGHVKYRIVGRTPQGCVFYYENRKGSGSASKVVKSRLCVLPPSLGVKKFHVSRRYGITFGELDAYCRTGS